MDQYPQDFKGGQRPKPLCNLKLNDAANLATIRGRLRSMIQDANVTATYMTHFLVELAEEIREPQAPEWVTMGYKIPAGMQTPLDLIHVVRSGGEDLVATDMPTTAQDNAWMAMYVMCGVRAAGLNQHQLRTFTATAEKKWRSATNPPKALDLDGLINRRYYFSDCRDLDVIVSAIDMFLNRYPHHKWSFLRFGSHVKRHEGCSVLLSLPAIAATIGLQECELVPWIRVSCLKIEVKALYLHKEELNQSDSYLPYLIGMKMSARSPYSVTANPGLHFFLHIIGACMREERSINALLKNTNNVYPILCNAAIVVLAFRSKAKLTEEEKINQQPDIEKEGDREIMKLEQAAFAKFHKNKQSFTADEVRVLSGLIQGIRSPRVGTVGHFVRHQMLNYLHVLVDD